MNAEKKELLSKSVSVSQLSKFVGSHRTHISSIINGRSSASEDLATLLAAACNLYTQRTGYYTKSDFILGTDDQQDDAIEQRIATLEIEIAQRIVTIDDLRRANDPTAPCMTTAFTLMHRLTNLVEGLKG